VSRLGWLVLFAGYQPPDGTDPPEISPLELQKGLFLLRQVAELSGDEVYDFEPYDYGPVSPEIYSDTRQVMAARLLHRSAAGPSCRFSYYRATHAGREVASELAREVNPQDLLYLEVIRSLLKELSFSEVVSAIYAAYPDYSVATTASDLLPSGPGAARKELATLFTPEEIRFRADTLLGMRQIERGKFLTRDQISSALKNGS
jgi:hypothetical protein